MEDNEFFRFPQLPKEEPPVPRGTGDLDDEDSKEGSSGSGINDVNFVPEWAEFQTNMLWKFDADRNIIINKTFKKMIKLSNLDSTKKILTTLNHFEQHPEMDHQGLVFALQKASIYNYQMSLSQLVEKTSENEILKWDIPVNIKLKIESNQEQQKIEEQKQEEIRKEKKEYNNKSDHMK